MDNEIIKILAVDDNRDNLVSLKALMNDFFPEVKIFTADGGQQGLDLAAKEVPDVIILDVVMPGMDGFEVCRRLKADPILSDIPVVFLTASRGDKESRIRALECGAEAFLSKPIDESELTAQIRAMLKIGYANKSNRNEKARLAVQVDEKTRELKDSNTKLKLNEERLRQNIDDLLESQRIAHVGTWRLDLVSNQVVWSDELYRMYGFDPSMPPPPYTEHMKLFTPESWDKLSTSLDRTSTLGIPYELELKTVPKVGSNGWMWVRGEAIKDSNGEIVALRGAAQDITERKEIEYELKRSEEKFKHLFEQAPIGYLALDAKGCFIEVNQKWLDIFGYNKDEVIGKWLGDFLCPEYVDAFRQRFELFKARGFVQSEVEILSKDGRRLLIAFEGKISYDADGKFRQTHGIMQDITVQRKTERALEESEERYRHLFEYSGVGIGYYTRDGVVISFNRKALESIGGALEDHVGKSIGELFPKEMAEVLYSRIEKAILADRPQDFEDYMYTKTGPKWFSSIMTNVKNIAGEVIGIQIASMDITERKLAEDALHKIEERFRIAQELSPDGFTILHPVRNETGGIIDFIFIYENQAIASINHTDPKKVIGKRLLDLLPNHRGTSIYDAYIHVANTGKTQIQDDVNVGEIVSEPKWLRMAIVSMGEDIAIHAQDITERKQAYLEQLFWQDMLRYVLENSFSSVAVMDKDMNYMFVSQNFLENFRITEKDITRMNHYKLFPNLPDIFKSVHNRVLAGETISSEEEVFHHADGSIDYTRYLLRPWYQISGEVGGMVMYIEFITERKQREQKNIEDIMKYRQQQKLESIGTLASGVAHEINNPIMGIINYAQLILDENNVADKNDYAKEIISEALRIADITKDLLFYSRQQKQEHSLASINDIILKTLSLVRSMLNKDQIDVQLNLNDDLPQLKCRSQQIQQIMMNLLTNAKDALNDRYPGGNPDKTIFISNNLFNEGGRRWIRVIVEDHGTGISPDVQQRVFDPFFSTKSRDIGTGLGLPISYGIAKDHHGRLFFDTETGRYTRFILELPVDNGWDIEEDK